MPTRPLRVCAAPRCPNRVPSGYCPEHQPARLDIRRPTDPRYGTMRWRRYSDQRKQEHPFCARCGLLAAGRDQGQARGVTDHITPVTERPDLFWDEQNHRTLCRRCNAVVRAERAAPQAHA